MELNSHDFRAVEVVLAHKIISILSRILGRKHNVHVNFFFVNNPIFVFTILCHRAFHFCKIRLVRSTPETHATFRQVLDYWFVQGAEVEFRDSSLASAESPPLSLCIVNSEDPSQIKNSTSSFSAKTKFIVYHNLTKDSRAKDIWSFMHPLWAVGDILEHEEICVAGDTYFILVCEKRGDS
jgi:hypothetical protein